MWINEIDVLALENKTMATSQVNYYCRHVIMMEIINVFHPTRTFVLSCILLLPNYLSEKKNEQNSQPLFIIDFYSFLCITSMKVV